MQSATSVACSSLRLLYSLPYEEARLQLCNKSIKRMRTRASS